MMFPPTRVRSTKLRLLARRLRHRNSAPASSSGAALYFARPPAWTCSPILHTSSAFDVRDE